MNRKTLVIVAGVAMFIGLMVMMFAPAPEVALAQQPTPTPQPPVAVLKIMSVPMNASLPGAITNTLTYITDTNFPAGGTTAIAYGATGLDNVPVNVPVRLSVTPLDAKTPVTKTTWTLTAPPDSKAKLSDPAAATPSFTPDVVGTYKVDVVLGNAAGSSPMASVKINAGTYIGVTAGNCKQCHPAKTAEWEKTRHAQIFTREIDKPSHGEYSERCIYCHTTGYHLKADNGGFDDVQAKTGWKFPTDDQIAKGGNWAAMPAELKNMANVQCEVCHGPANEHVKNGTKVMASGMDQGVCDICHNGSTRHYKGTDMQSAKHSEENSRAWTYPTGPARQDCVRCHSGAGFTTFLQNPANKAAWDNNAEALSCASCHDPHDDTNPWQLRIAGKPSAEIQKYMPFEVKDVGLSTTCYMCHNANAKPDAAIKGSFPHYSSVAEFLSDTGGVTYGATVPNSVHGLVVGSQPMANPAAAKDPEAPKYMFSYADKTKNTPGPCVVCHMWETITDSKDPNFHKVGAHSFNTVSPDGKFDYLAPCLTCHTDQKDAKSFNWKAKADYDGNGQVEGVQDEVKGLLNVLWKALEAKGVKQTAGNPYATGITGADVDPKVQNAWYNYRTVYGVMWSAGADGKIVPGNEGKAQAVHNFKRSVALLQLSIKDLTGSLPAGMTEIK